MSPLHYKVYTRWVGEKKKQMIAGFAELVDAVNYAHAMSRGKYTSQEGGH